MKKSLLLIVFVSTVFAGKAQMWCSPGAQWHYGHQEGSPFLYSYLKLNYVSDSIINTITYKKLKTVRYGTGFVTNYPLILLNDNNKLVTLFNGNIDTLFNFNAIIGDKWLRVRIGDPNLDVTRRYVTVLDTGHVIINSVSLKKIILSYQVGGWPTATVTTYNDTVYEKLGSIRYFLNPAYIEKSTMATDGGFYVNGDFRCYSDNSFTLYHKLGSLNCTDVVGINELVRDHAVNVYPNPTSSILNIIDEQNQLQNATIEIANYLGQRVFSESYSNQIDVSHFSSGVYTITIKTNSGALYHAKFVRE
jgi:hypothetical protein